MKTDAIIVTGCCSLSLGLALTLAPALLAWDARARPAGAGVAGKTGELLGWYCLRKADDYFHSGALGTVFDQVNEEQRAGEIKAAGGNALPDDHWICTAPSFGPALDWMDGFSRHFFPTRHTHLTEGGARAQGSNLVHEILPWFWLAAALNPRNPEAYLEAAYWLRRDSRHPAEAEAFLRQGLRANPCSYEIRFELGRVFEEDRHAPAVARIHWECGLQLWEQGNAGRRTPDDFMLRRLSGSLARLEEQQGNYEQALRHWARLKPFSASPAKIESWMQELRAKLAPPTNTPAPFGSP